MSIFDMHNRYYQIHSNFNTSRIVKLVLEVQFYTLVIGIFDIVYWGQYWFFSSYFVIMILSPFLNKFVLSSKKRNDKVAIDYYCCNVVCYSYCYWKRYVWNDPSGSNCCLPFRCVCPIIHLQDEKYIKKGRLCL